MTARARIIAFYLPQYHPIPENDEWWGNGFTEWTNVAKAKPLFRGHYQPRVPADLGFYDLRVPETRLAQAEMARNYGVEAFCYWHYWFAGRRVLERPFEEVLKSGEPDFPFCLAWANETWSGVWHGCPERTLIQQTYPGADDYRAHFKAVLRAFSDARYLTVDGKPLFYVFKPHKLPDAREFTDIWREMALKAGLSGLYLVGHSPDPWDPRDGGFDAVETSAGLPSLIEKRPWYRPVKRLRWRWKTLRSRPTIYPYEDMCEAFVDTWTDRSSHITRHVCLLPNWDNTPRSGMNGIVLHGSTPELFRGQVRKALQKVAIEPFQHRIVFLKSWNEWAEGNYLEPDQRFGRGYLEVLRTEIFGDRTGEVSHCDTADRRREDSPVASTSSARADAATRLSVIIPTRDRPIELGHLLWSLFSQRCGPGQILVVDQSGGDDTGTVVDSFANLCTAVHGKAPELVYLHDRAVRGASPARNVGIDASTGDILLFLDDDELLEPDFIHELLEVYERDPAVGGVSGVVTNYPLPRLGLRIIGRLFWRGPFRDERQPIYWRADRLRQARPIGVTKFGSGVMSVRRSVLGTDRFDDSLKGLPPGEDVDLCCRLAARTSLVITPRARLINLMSSTGRTRPHWLETDAQATYYLYRRNWRTGVKNRLAFAWLNVGYALFASAACVRRRSLNPWRALRAGVRSARAQVH